MEQATFGAGCFWCVEAVFQNLEGVEEVISGYTGGFIKNPAYREVCNGTTGHAEVCRITFDPEVISFEELLDIFFQTHDPTTLNRQGNDVGTQYRSAIFYHDDLQKEKAIAFKKKLDDVNFFGAPVVTEISPLGDFYVAENAHQNYYNENASQPYCTFIVKPKVDKLKKLFSEKLKSA